MKKLLLILTFVSINLALYAQFSVNSSGNSNVPNNKSFYIGNFGDSNYRMRLYNSSSFSIFDFVPDLYFRSAPTGSGGYPTVVIFKNNGHVGIGNTNPSYRLDVNGTVRGTSFITSSDARLKHNITPLTSAVKMLNDLNGVRYNYRTDIKVTKVSPIDGSTFDEPVVDIKDERKKMGLLAQNVQEVFPELVYQDENGYLGVDYVSMIPVLIEAIKEQQIEINELKKRMSE